MIAVPIPDETTHLSLPLRVGQPQPLYAIQHIRKMRGGSQAQLMRASDGAFYVVKFKAALLMWITQESRDWLITDSPFRNEKFVNLF